MSNQVIMLVLNYVVRILCIIISTYILSIIRKHNLEKWVEIGIKSAEQIFSGEGLGDQKKQHVVNFINNKFKFGVSVEDLDNLIESICKDLDTIGQINNK
mgnify:FL=1